MVGVANVGGYRGFLTGKSGLHLIEAMRTGAPVSVALLAAQQRCEVVLEAL